MIWQFCSTIHSDTSNEVSSQLTFRFKIDFQHDGYGDHLGFPIGTLLTIFDLQKKVREKSRECHNHKPQPFPDPKRNRKPANPNKHKPNKRMKSTKISSLFPKRGNRNIKRTAKHKNKMTHGKTYNKSPRRINHKATKSKTNTGTTALEVTPILPISDRNDINYWSGSQPNTSHKVSSQLAFRVLRRSSK